MRPEAATVTFFVRRGEGSDGLSQVGLRARQRPGLAQQRGAGPRSPRAQHLARVKGGRAPGAHCRALPRRCSGRPRLRSRRAPACRPLWACAPPPPPPRAAQLRGVAPRPLAPAGQRGAAFLWLLGPAVLRLWAHHVRGAAPGRGRLQRPGCALSRRVGGCVCGWGLLLQRGPSGIEVRRRASPGGAACVAPGSWGTLALPSWALPVL